jgi:amiloride-sensitive sodium channel
MCDIESGTICRKQQNFVPNCNPYAQSQLSVLFNPVLYSQIKVNANLLKDSFQSIFNRINRTSAFEGIFSLLWYSALPCFDVNGITSVVEGEKSILKSCFWKGLRVPCASIFNTFPTDQGMCCAFNMKSADDIFQQITYSKMVMEKQSIEKKSSFMDYNIPNWYDSTGEPTIQPGINKGLTIILDAHNDLLSEGSVDTDSYGFTGVITNRGSYPLTNREGFQIIPGHSNQIGLSATKISAVLDIMSIDPKKRNCLFPDENSAMKMHKKYSQSSCLLECALFYAQRKLAEAKNMSKPCLPWYFPTYEEIGTICDPWEAAEFDDNFNNVPDSECSNCLPDCDTVIYEPSITTIPFRRCDFRNLGTSPMCNLDDALLPEPKIWARQVMKQLQVEQQLEMLNTFKYTSSERKYKNDLMIVGAFNPYNETYDAYEKDIAMVQIFFKTSSIIEFGTSARQTWIDYFSSIGGLLGLCIGLSILTLIELVWWFLIIVANVLSPRTKKIED